MTRTEAGNAFKSALIQVIVAAAAGLAIWYGIVNSELAVLSERIAAIERDSGRTDKQYEELSNRLAKMESRIDQIYLVLTGSR